MERVEIDSSEIVSNLHPLLPATTLEIMSINGYEKERVKVLNWPAFKEGF